MRRTRVSPLLLAEDRSTVQGGGLPGVVTPAPSRGAAPICDSERRGAPGLAALASRRPPSSTERWRDSRDVAGAALGNSASPVAPVAPPPSPRRRHCGDSDIRLRRGECWLARGGLAWVPIRNASRSGAPSAGPGSVVSYGPATAAQLVYQQPDVASKPVSLNPRPTLLAGREDLLAGLDTWLSAGYGPRPRIVALYGLGGLGRSCCNSL